jgi:hypothetical protein
VNKLVYGALPVKKGTQISHIESVISYKSAVFAQQPIELPELQI